MNNTQLSAPAQQQKTNALQSMATRLGVDESELMATLTNTVFKGAKPHEFTALVAVANEYKLNPLLKQIYAFPAKGMGIVPIVGVDGWLSIMNRQPNLNGFEITVKEGQGGKPESATISIHLKDREFPVVVTEYYAECYRNTDPWKQMPRRMLRNKVISQGVRIAFGVSGVHDEDEGRDMGMRDVSPTPSGGGGPIPVKIESAPAPAATSTPTPAPAPAPVQVAEPAPQPKAAPAQIGTPLNEVLPPQAPQGGTLNARIDGVEQKTSKNGRPFSVVRYSTQSGAAEASTFSTSVGEGAHVLVGQNAQITIERKTSKDNREYINLTNIMPADVPAPQSTPVAQPRTTLL